LGSFSAAELLEDVAGLVGQADLHEHQQAGLEEVRVQPRVVAGDGAIALQPAHPLGARRGRQADPLAQFGEGNTPFLLQNAQDLAVDLVQFAGACGHGAGLGGLGQGIALLGIRKSAENPGLRSIYCA
jgi:hypothetical protein